MTIYADNYEAIVERGGSRDNTQYEVWKCCKCGTYALYENEKSIIYLDHKDLTKGHVYGLDTNLEEVKCLSCGTIDSFDEASDEDLVSVQNSIWNFIFKK